jgi:hypothetical protein
MKKTGQKAARVGHNISETYETTPYGRRPIRHRFRVWSGWLLLIAAAPVYFVYRRLRHTHSAAAGSNGAAS